MTDFEFRDWRSELRHHDPRNSGWLSRTAKLFKGDVWIANIEVWHSGRYDCEWRAARLATPEAGPAIAPLLQEMARREREERVVSDARYAAETARRNADLAEAARLALFGDKDPPA